MNAPSLHLSSTAFRKWMTVLAVLLAMLSFAGFLCSHFLQFRIPGLFRVFDVTEERSIPTWFSAVNLALSAGLIALVSLWLTKPRHHENRAAWIWLGIAFALFSLDEIVGFHEGVGILLSSRIERIHRFSAFAWVIPGLIVLPVVALAYLRFLRRLPARTRNQFVLAALLFIGGGLGVEAVQGVIFAGIDPTRLVGYNILAHLEELLEMLGIVLFNAALVEYLAAEGDTGGVRVEFSGTVPQPPASKSTTAPG